MRRSCPGCPIYRELPPINEVFAAGPSRDGLHPGGCAEPRVQRLLKKLSLESSQGPKVQPR